MEDWAVLHNWALFLPLAFGITAYYYWPRASTTTPIKSEPVHAVNNVVKSEKTAAPKQKKAPAAKAPASKVAANKEKPAPITKEKPAGHVIESKTKEKVDRKVEPSAASVEEDADDSLREAREFAKRMTQARQGVEVKSNDIKGGRVKTVKQSSALSADSVKATPVHAESADDEEESSTRDAGSVADMLEPVAPAPTTLRITPSEKPIRSNGQPKQQKDNKSDAQSKKARQNERKKEEQRLQREEDEKIRKALEEKQRRTAREARGEAAKNGIPAPAKEPASNSWTAKPSITPSAEQGSTANIALLDTFDEESSGTSRNGTTNNGPQANTTSNNVGEQLDDAAWTTAGSKRKQKKSQVAADKPNDAPVLPKPVVSAATKPTTNGKPIGFQALTDEYEQRTDVDANDASNWDA